jgi:hypothetical protein
MPYDATIETLENHIRAYVTGTRVPGQAVTDADVVGEELVKLCRETDINKVLLVIDLAGRLSAIDAYEIVSSSEQYGWSRKIKLAFVDLNAESLEDSYFTETVAVNRAFPMSVFDNEEEALDWLLDGRS